MQEQKQEITVYHSQYFILIFESRVGAPVVGKHAAPPSPIREYEGILLGQRLIALNPKD